MLNLHAMTTQELIELRGKIESVLFYRIAGDPRTEVSTDMAHSEDRMRVYEANNLRDMQPTMLGALLPNEVTCGSK